MLGKSSIARANAYIARANAYALAALSGAFSDAATAAANAAKAIQIMPRTSQITRDWPVYSRSKYRPHQGARECARRRGGDDWAQFKARDRVRRGLPVSWPFQHLEG